ncbi:hypothetical protein BN946_scf184450.g1 [Trametes cinnabarina]|uniref:Uncharacterized protein n=1 Tax=Pycnoporus cinnabarinus TaxID=5643 RepID=A0A060STG5_PYCCI|nr:hypothetical protein BN946_scf184450.g1 [Trametes cinnabarina]
MTDTNILVKETQTCNYIVNISTSRIRGGKPGFRSRLDTSDSEEHSVCYCQVLDGAKYEGANRNIHSASHPFSRAARHRKVIAPPPPPPAVPKGAANDAAKANGWKAAASAAAVVRVGLLHHALEHLKAHCDRGTQARTRAPRA